MKTTIYDLLGMIKDGKTPKKILFKEQIYEYTRTGYYDSDNGETLFDTYYIDEILNDEVEILETTITFKQDTSKIEMIILTAEERKLSHAKWIMLVDKINEIIEVLNER